MFKKYYVTCKIVVIFSLNIYKGISEILISSIRIRPCVVSKILTKALIMVDFPAPVLPTTPIFNFLNFFIINF